MKRYTKRTHKGKAKFDVIGPYAERLAEYEDTGMEPFEIIMMQDCWNRFKDAHSCNDCNKKDCKYKPDWGNPVRLNCPLWEGGNEQ